MRGERGEHRMVATLFPKESITNHRSPHTFVMDMRSTEKHFGIRNTCDGDCRPNSTSENGRGRARRQEKASQSTDTTPEEHGILLTNSITKAFIFPVKMKPELIFVAYDRAKISTRYQVCGILTIIATKPPRYPAEGLPNTRQEVFEFRNIKLKEITLHRNRDFLLQSVVGDTREGVSILIASK